MDEIIVTFPGLRRVEAAFGPHVVCTDQSPEHGGEGSAPEPYELFLASMATCAGAYVVAFCEARGIPTSDLKMVQRSMGEQAGHIPARIEIELVVPPDFPERYRMAVARAAESCKVKRTLGSPPEVAVVIRVRQAERLAAT
jgi:ribosomal protein S12 methylthiotransferase accessory factor